VTVVSPALSLAGLPLALPDEVIRPRLLARLEGRWQHPVTVIRAGAGFGKSTLLAQAVRANAIEPRGIDVWHVCSPGDVDADALGRALLGLLGARGRSRDPVAELADAVVTHSPIDVCIVLDDAHEARPGSSGGELLDRFARLLPDNSHLVLATRHAPAVRLSRFRASDRLVELTQEDLVFTGEETSTMAHRLGREPAAALALGGWPALVRLALAVQPEVAIDFAQEEVLNNISAEQRRALFALSNLGYASRDRVARVIGFDVDVASLAGTVPLVSHTGDGLFRAHDLWTDALLRVLAPQEVADLRGRIVEELIASGDCARAGTLAQAHGDIDALTRVAMDVVRRTVAALPVDMVQPWNDILQRARPEAPETHLVAAAVRQAVDFKDVQADVDIDEAATGFHRRTDFDGEVAALVIGTIGSYMRGDIARLLDLARRAEALPNARNDPTIDVALRAIAAIGAEMAGDLAGALDELHAAPLDRVASAIRISISRLLVHCLLLSGRADEAVDVTRQLLALKSDRTTRYLWAIARWISGRPDELLALNKTTVDFPAVTSRDEFVRRTVVASMLASTGRRDEVHGLVKNGPRADGSLDARDAVLDAVARALCAIVDHDEARAAALIAGVVGAHADSPILDQHLRRFLALVYVLDPDVRRRWDEAQMGPTHVRTRMAGRWLIDLRARRSPGAVGLDPAQIFTAFPLSWSVELAVRLYADRQPDGSRLAEWLVNQSPEAARAELRFLADDAGAVGRAASELLARLPAVPTRRLEISVLGPLAITIDGTRVTGSALRRSRVRTLLALLTVHGTITRDLAIDLLWPEHDAAGGARNLRVTLTYLRQLLEPDRQAGEASFHLRADANTITLHPSDHLVVDLWELRRLTDEAINGAQGADSDGTIALLQAARSLWRGDPLIDLGSVVGQDHEVERVRLLQLESLLRLSELRLVRGAAGLALVDAEGALAVDPYSERAHRLAIAAALRLHDRPRAAAVSDRALAMLDELGVEPEPATQILLRRVRAPSTH
jgi:DNA-binding SARP family transcriptional activator